MDRNKLNLFIRVIPAGHMIQTSYRVNLHVFTLQNTTTAVDAFVTTHTKLPQTRL